MTRYLYIHVNRQKYPVAKMVQWANVSSSGYYEWLHRTPSKRAVENADLLKEIQQIHEESHHTYGSKRITILLNRDRKKPINHKRVERIMILPTFGQMKAGSMLQES